jgi:hypothetical protein
MKTIVRVEIECDGEYCGKCTHMLNSGWHPCCRLFSEPLDKNEDKVLRCKVCKDNQESKSGRAKHVQDTDNSAE